jgi:hypothetical protein
VCPQLAYHAGSQLLSTAQLEALQPSVKDPGLVPAMPFHLILPISCQVPPPQGTLPAFPTSPHLQRHDLIRTWRCYISTFFHVLIGLISVLPNVCTFHKGCHPEKDTW